MAFYLILAITVINLTILIILLCKFAKKSKRPEVKINPKLESRANRELMLFLDGECKLRKPNIKT